MFLPLTAALLLGLLLGSYLPYLPFLTLFLLILIAGILITGEYLGRLTGCHGTLMFAAMLSGLLYWTAYIGMTTGADVPDRAGDHPVRVAGTVVEPVRLAPTRAVMVLSELALGEDDRAFPVQGRVRVAWREADRPLRQGDRVVFTGRLRVPSGTVNPGGFDYGAYLKRQGIDAVASVSGPGQVTVRSSAALLSRWGLWRLIDERRDRVHHAAVSTLNGTARAIYLAIILGEPGYLTPEVRDAFMMTGTVHILSISGSHLGLIALLSFLVIRWTCLGLPTAWLLALSRRVPPTRLAALLTTIPVTFYTLLAGAETATVRSLVMILVFLLAVWLGREGDLRLSLAVAAVVILAYDPRALFDISFQLSFVSVLAIALVLRRRTLDRSSGRPGLDGGNPRLLGWLKDGMWIGGGATLATLPIVAYHFNQIAWLGLGANLIVVPLAGFVVVPVGLGSAVWLLLTGSEALPLALINQGGLDLMAGVVEALARLPGAEWHVASPTIPAIACFYGLLYAAGLSTCRVRLRYGSVLGAALLLGWWAWSPRGLSDGETLRVSFLDVGQGDACLLELPDGQTVLIDAGARSDTVDMGRTVVGPYLWDRGIRRLDHVIGTHPQLDHIGGLPAIVRSVQVGHYWGNGIAREEEFYRRLQAALQKTGMAEQRAEEDQMIVRSGPCRLIVLNPPRQSVGDRRSGSLSSTSAVSGTALNNRSVVTRLTCGPHSFLFTADIEQEALWRLRETGRPLQTRVLKVPHHGATSSFDARWVEAVGAEVAVISVGSHNAYGHPSVAVVSGYRTNRSQVFRTDRHGAVLIRARLSSPDMEIRTARDGLPHPLRVGESLFAGERENVAKLWRQWMG